MLRFIHLLINLRGPCYKLRPICRDSSFHEAKVGRIIELIKGKDYHILKSKEER